MVNRIINEVVHKLTDEVIGNFETTCVGHIGDRYNEPNQVRNVTVGKLRRHIDIAIIKAIESTLLAASTDQPI